MAEAPSIPDLTLLRRIGRGSYGEVWLARTVTGVYRAVKIVYRARFEDDRPFLRELDGITRFQNSAGGQPRQLALMHVGINEEQGFFYYVMELADDLESGTDIDPDRYEPYTLKALLQRQPALPADQVVRLGIDLARALQGLHENGLIHRDVKPSNIIMVGGTAKIADIGLVSSSDHTLTSLGTPGYSPPEGAGTVRADIYSLGRILYEMVTGRPPSDYPLLPADLQQRRDASALLELNEVVLRACAPDPRDRYADTGELLNDLLLIEAGKSVQELFRMRRRLKQLARLAGITGIVAAVAVAGIGIHDYLTLRKLAATEAAARIRAEADEKRARYTANLNLAQLALDDANIGSARSALRRARETTDLPGLEWRALWNDTRGVATKTFGPIGGPAVTALMLSPDRRFIATQQEDRQRHTLLWDIASGQSRELAADGFRLAGFSPDGATVLKEHSDGSLQAIDVASGTTKTFAPPRENLHHREANSLFITSGRRLETGFQITRWDTASLLPAGTWESGADSFPATGYSANILDRSGDRLALVLLADTGATRRRQLAVIDFPSATVIFRKDDPGNLQSLAFSPDGATLAGAGIGLPVRIWDLESGSITMELPGLATDVFDLEFSADGRFLAAAAGDQTVRIWSLATRALAATLRDHEGEVTAVRWIDNETLASSSRDGTVRLWRRDAPAPVFIRAGFWENILGDVIYNKERETWFASLDDGTISALDVDTLEPTGPALPAFHPLAFQGRQLLALTNEMKLVRIDPDSGETHPTKLALPASPRTSKAIASPGGELAVFGRGDGSIVIWDCEHEVSLLDLRVHDKYVWALATNAAGTRAASGGRDGSVVLWDKTTGTTETVLPPSGLETSALAFAPDDQHLLVGRSDGSVESIALATREVVRTVHPHTKSVAWIEVSRSGDRIVTGGYDGLVAVFNDQLERQLGLLRIQPFGAAAGDFAASRVRLADDEQSLVVLTQNGRLRRWLLRQP